MSGLSKGECLSKGERLGLATRYKKECLTSSMDWAKEELDAVGDGTLFLADTYHVARGRQGRVWVLHPGQMILTFVLKPKNYTELNVDWLSMALTVGVADVLKEYGVGVKWPNDFVVGGKKVGGILIEAVWEGETIKGFIIGIAINVMNDFSKDDPLFNIATSLKTVGAHACVERLRGAVVASLDSWYAAWKVGEFDKIFSAWKNFQVCLGKEVSVHLKDGTSVCGIVKDVAPNGDLVLEKGQVRFCLVERVDHRPIGV